jgi:hypothetical protein
MAVHDGHIVPPLNKEVWPVDKVFDEKFAELIVRECANAADMYEGQSDYVGDCVAEYMGYGEAEGVAEWRAK